MEDTKHARPKPEYGSALVLTKACRSEAVNDRVAEISEIEIDVRPGSSSKGSGDAVTV